MATIDNNRFSPIATVSTYLGEKNYHFSSDETRQKVVELLATQACFNLQHPEWMSAPCTAKESAAIHSEVSNSLYAIAQPFSPQAPPDPSAKKDYGYHFKNVIQATPNCFSEMMGDRKQALIALKEIVLWQGSDPVIFPELVKWVKEALKNAYTDMPDPRLREIYLNHLLAYYPFLSPPEGDTLEIPQGPNAELVTYNVEKVFITPPWLGSPLVAYGLKPTAAHPQAAPMLLLKGTTYPTDYGFFLSYLTDHTPFGPVGGFTFYCLGGQGLIETWLKSCTNKPIVLGVSLGGALTLLTAAHFPDLIKKAYSFNSPAMTSGVVEEWTKNSKNLQEKPDVLVLQQAGDLVGALGRQWSDEWQLIYGHPTTNGPKGLHNHLAADSSRSDALYYKRPPAVDNAMINRRLWLIFQNGLFVFPFALGLLIMPIWALVHAIIKLAKSIFSCCSSRPKPQSESIRV